MIIRGKPVRQVILAAVAVLMVCSFFAVQRVTSIAAIQDALERDWEISFDGGGGQCPGALPRWLDDAAESVIRRVIGPEPAQPFLHQKLNRDVVWQERFRSLFLGRITEIEIYYPGRLRDDLGAALARCPSLRRLVIHRADFSNSDWAHVFAGLHRLRHLEELEISSYELRDSTIAPLAGQASLRKVEISLGRLGTESIGTFARLPKLTELSLSESAIDDGHESPEPVLPEMQQMFRGALPHVRIRF